MQREIDFRKEIKYVVGLDPDLHRPGTAIWSTEELRYVYIGAMSFTKLMKLMKESYPAASTRVIVEAGWLIGKSNFRGGTYLSSQSKAADVGRNHASGKILAAMLTEEGYEVELIKPLSKGKGLLKSKGGQWTAVGKKYIQDIIGDGVRLNDDARDAVYIVHCMK